jgi:hypothetical protein
MKAESADVPMHTDADNVTGFRLRCCKRARKDAGASTTPMHDTSYAIRSSEAV